MSPNIANEVILGIWGYSSDVPEVLHHDAGAAVIVAGEIMAAVNEERMTRRKNEGRWPEASIEEVLRLAGVSSRDVTQVALAGMPPLRRAGVMAGELIRTYRKSGSLLPNRWLYALLSAKKIKRYGPDGVEAPVRFVAHHDAHAAAAYYTTPFSDPVIVTLDGIGDSTYCGGVFIREDSKIRAIRHFSGYASIGILYSYITKGFGFKPARHEGKITGLAAHGDSDVLIGEFRKRLRYENRELISDFIPQLFRAHEDAKWETSWVDGLLKTHSREDIAAALQRHTEELAVRIVQDALADTGKRNVALAGGVFANVRVNQEIRKVTPGNVWIHPHMGDGGLALGAALHVAGKVCAFPDVYLGSLPGLLSKVSGIAGVQSIAEVEPLIAKACHLGLIVGHVSGRMEYGPRALGHRTIFASATDAAINDSLNERLHRTEFMPFAPIMTNRAAKKLLKDWSVKDTASKYMTITYNVTEECRRAVPAVVHVDDTARPQVVYPHSERLYRILEEYGKLSGTEALINTSFNIHEEPIVRTAEDAYRAFQAGGVDLLVVENEILANAVAKSKLGL